MKPVLLHLNIQNFKKGIKVPKVVEVSIGAFSLIKPLLNPKWYF